MANEIEIAAVDPADRFAIVVAEWNRSITEKLVAGAMETLAASGVDEQRIDLAWVPGSAKARSS